MGGVLSGMTMNPLPPQAYTKDTLAHAFAWLQNQTESIKEMASNPDILVGLYLKAKLQGDEALERPSIQNFKNELRSLAGMMGEFTTKQEHRPEHRPESRPEHRTEHRSEPMAKSQPAPAAMPGPAKSAQQFSASQQNITPTPPPRTETQMLDQKSLQMIREVKEQFNLSSDSEALRLLISAGSQSLKGLIHESRR